MGNVKIVDREQKQLSITRNMQTRFVLEVAGKTVECLTNWTMTDIGGPDGRSVDITLMEVPSGFDDSVKQQIMDIVQNTIGADN